MYIKISLSVPDEVTRLKAVACMQNISFKEFLKTYKPKNIYSVFKSLKPISSKPVSAAG